LVSFGSVAVLSLVLAPGAGAAAEDEEKNAARMTLSDCLTRALENNLDLRIAKLDPEAAHNQTTFQAAVFDPVLGAGASYGENKSDFETTRSDLLNPPPTTSNDGNDGSQILADLSLAQRLSFGADYSVALNGVDQKSSGDSFNPPNFFTLQTSENKDVALDLKFNLPLLKGLGREVNTVSLVLARNDARISDEELRRRAQITLKAVEDAYWDVAAARAAVKVSRQSLKLAQDLFDLNKKKVEVGTLAPIEITQAEAGVASREEGVIVADNLLRDTEDNLRRLLAVPKDDPLWGQPIIPADQPRSEPQAIDLDAALATALTQRSEIRNARLQLESSDLSARVARKNIRHELNLAVDVTSSRFENSFDTLAGTPPTPVVTTDLNNGKGGPDWSVGLVYSYPIGNRAAKANSAIAEISKERSQIAAESAEQDVRVDVRTAVRAVESGAKRVAAAHANTVLQQKTVDAELKKFDNGMSTSFEVLRIQTDLSDAQVAEIRAVLDYNKSLADLERAKGTLLEAKGLKLADNAGR
jgi:outer membrane protein TolC